jgi:hypothetical protein
MGATYFREIVIEFMISDGWNYNSVYGNSHRVKERIAFSISSCEPTRQFFVLVQPKREAK